MNIHTQQILATKCKLVLALTGGGSRVVSELLGSGGAGNHVIACHLPYSPSAIERYIGFGALSRKFCSATTASELALRAWHEGREAVAGEDEPWVLGVGLACCLAKIGPERLDRKHHVWLAIRNNRGETTIDKQLYMLSDLDKPMLRDYQEGKVQRFVMEEIAMACKLMQEQNGTGAVHADSDGLST